MKDVKNVCVLIRVYNRTEDLKYCIEIIRNTWKIYNYYIIVVFNGEENGYIIDNESLKTIDHLIKIPNNIGHFSGNSQLLLAGLPHIPDTCLYTIILEADTWIYKDAIVKKYIYLLEDTGAVWASAQFFRYVLNLATDFALINTAFAKSHPELFTFKETPEYYVANYLTSNNHKFLYVKENMPINLPRYIRKYPYAPTGRFFIFPTGKMVTHHIESLKDGMDEKKFYFNVIAGTQYFNVPNLKPVLLTKSLFSIFVALTVVIPYKGWFINKKTSI